MKYKITTHCCWFRGGSMIVKMYFINGMPFTFDELPDGHLEDQELIKEADKYRTFNDDEMYQYYGYLVEEELHPCLFPVELENPEELPDDISIHIDTDEF
tara:strand:- start:45 stop:344 length:300 start_codon:yes stop_codon:yes gene_type:complete